MELQQVERRGRQHGIDRRIVGVDEEPDAGDAGGHRLAQFGDARGGDVARAPGIEDEAEEGGAAGNGGRDAGGLGEAADFDGDAQRAISARMAPAAAAGSGEAVIGRPMTR